jgi:hypothetical protein
MNIFTITNGNFTRFRIGSKLESRSKSRDLNRPIPSGLLLQGENLIAEYYSKVEICNDAVKFCKDYLKGKFIIGLTPENCKNVLTDSIFP